MHSSPRQFLFDLFETALKAALPTQVLADYLPEPPKGRTIVIGAGKAAASMAASLEQQWLGNLEGLVVTRYGHGAATRSIEVVEASHPVPDQAGQDAAVRIMELAHSATADDLVIVLISGGASALLSLPAEGLSLADKQAINRALLHSGAPIDAMNQVRKRLSAIKGGRLAAAIAPAKAVSLLISDVPGDDLGTIGSGPSVADCTSAQQALAVLDHYGIAVTTELAAIIQRNHSVKRLAANQSVHLIATPQMALNAAAELAQAAGIKALILSDRIEGEAREVAKVMAAIAQQVRQHAQPLAPPCVLLSGGETTVTVNGNGRGGRNAEFLLALANALAKTPGIYAIACDTDGIDGVEKNAGAIIAPDSLTRAEALGLNPAEMLADNNAYEFFADLGDLIVTGPTLTNVNDFRAIYITAP